MSGWAKGIWYGGPDGKEIGERWDYFETDAYGHDIAVAYTAEATIRDLYPAHTFLYWYSCANMDNWRAAPPAIKTMDELKAWAMAMWRMQ